jgi:cytochrome c biogenesis protein CcmG/thiol:disulfide interchange protein DsbE
MSFDRSYHVDYPVVRDVSGTFVRSFGTDAVPETFVINRQGKVQAVRREPVTAQWFRQTLPKILAGRA